MFQNGSRYRIPEAKIVGTPALSMLSGDKVSALDWAGEPVYICMYIYIYSKFHPLKAHGLSSLISRLNSFFFLFCGMLLYR